MSDAKRDAAAAWIAARRLEPAPHIGALDVALRPRDAAEGYAVQRRVNERLVAAGHGPARGWKVGSTTPAMQRLLGVPEPCAGTILATALQRDGVALSGATFRRVGVECEVAVRLDRRLDAREQRLSRAEIEAAVGDVYPAIEIVDDRYGDWEALGAPTMIADDFFQAAVVLGAAAPHWRRLDLASLAGITVVNGETRLSGRGSDVLGHPFNSIAWLADCLAKQGLCIEAGQIVMTGSLTLPHWAQQGETVEVRLGELGEASVCFA